MIAIVKIGGKIYKINATGLVEIVDKEKTAPQVEKNTPGTIKYSYDKRRGLVGRRGMVTFRKGVKLFGLTEMEQTAAATDADYINIIRKGIRKKSIDQLMEATEIPVAQMAEIMETTPVKLAAIKPNVIMEKSQSEKVVLIARLYSLGEQVLGNQEEFNKWMNGRVPSLGKKKPKEYLDTVSGINLLMDELGRIQYGVYS